MSIMKAMTFAENVRRANEQRNENLESAQFSRKMAGDEGEGDYVTLPSGIRVRLKKPSLTSMLGGNPLESEGMSDDDEMEMLKLTRGQ